MYAVTVLALAIALIIIGPIFTIGALNTLFSMGIPLNFWTWLSTAWLQIVLASQVKSSESK